MSLPTFTGLENEGNTLPSGVVDPEGGSSKSRANGVGRNGIILEVSRFTIGCDILAEKGVFSLDGRDGPKYFDLE